MTVMIPCKFAVQFCPLSLTGRPCNLFYMSTSHRQFHVGSQLLCESPLIEPALLPRNKSSHMCLTHACLTHNINSAAYHSHRQTRRGFPLTYICFAGPRRLSKSSV